MDPLEVFGAVAAAIGLVQTFRRNFGQARRVGMTLDDLRLNLWELHQLQSLVDPERDAVELSIIARLVEDTMTLLDENRHTRRVAAMTFFWSNMLDSDAQRINVGLAQVGRCIERRTSQHSRFLLETANRRLSSLLEASTVASITPDGRAELPTPGTTPATSINGSIRHSPKLESSAVSEAGESSAQVVPADGSRFHETHPRRRSSNRLPPMSATAFPTIALPTTLLLYDANNNLVRRPIHLNHFSILERNTTTRHRIVQYDSATAEITITHTIPFGTIPSTHDDLDACEVSFLDHHVVTYESQTEYAVYRLDPLYRFQNHIACNSFMARVRERALLASFIPREIRLSSIPGTSGAQVIVTDNGPDGGGHRGSSQGILSRLSFSSPTFPSSPPRSATLGVRREILARRKVVRFWRRTPDDPQGQALVTMTFHDRTRDPPKFTEWSLKDFRSVPTERRRGLEIELSRSARNEQFTFDFVSLEEARRFRAAFERYRPT